MSEIQNHPECRRWFLGVTGPAEQRDRIILTWENFTHSRGWHWRCKRRGERDYVLIGSVERLPDPFDEIRIIELVAAIY